MSGMMDDYNRLDREREANPFQPDNDNDKAPERLRELFGKKVRVKSANDSSRWDGYLAGYFERPVIVVAGYGSRNHGGIHSSGLILPATYPVEELPPPPKIDPCPSCGHVPTVMSGDVEFLW